MLVTCAEAVLADRYVAITLSKVELILNALSTGFSLAWMDAVQVHSVLGVPQITYLQSVPR